MPFAIVCIKNKKQGAPIMEHGNQLAARSTHEDVQFGRLFLSFWLSNCLIFDEKSE